MDFIILETYVIGFAVVLGILPIIIIQFIMAKKNPELFAIMPYLWLICLGDLQEIGGRLYYLSGGLNYQTRYFFFAYTVMEFFAISYYFGKQFGSRYKILRYSFVCVFMATLLYILFSWRFEDAYVNMTYISIIVAVMVLLFCVLWFNKMMLKETSFLMIDRPDFIFTAAFLIYYSGTILLFVFDDYLTTSGHFARFYFAIIMFFGILLRLMLILGVIKAKKRLPGILS